MAIYSTFLQRGFDPIVHDVCLQNLPVTFCLDRAGLSANDGPTHHGLFDLAYLRCIPNTTLMQPKDEDELADMLYTAVSTPSPTFLRYPRGAGLGVQLKAKPVLLPLGRAELLRQGRDLALWAIGPMVAEADRLAARLAAQGISCTVVNARFIKPLDRELLHSHAQTHRLLVTLEDHSLAGGFGSAVLEALQDAGLSIPVERIGWPDVFIGHASSNEHLRQTHGLSHESLHSRLSRLAER